MQEMLDEQYGWEDLSEDTASDVVYIATLFGKEIEYVLNMTPWKFGRIKSIIIKNRTSGVISEDKFDIPRTLV